MEDHECNIFADAKRGIQIITEINQSIESIKATLATVITSDTHAHSRITQHKKDLTELVTTGIQSVVSAYNALNVKTAVLEERGEQTMKDVEEIKNSTKNIEKNVQDLLNSKGLLSGKLSVIVIIIGCLLTAILSLGTAILPKLLMP